MAMLNKQLTKFLKIKQSATVSRLQYITVPSLLPVSLYGLHAI